IFSRLFQFNVTAHAFLREILRRTQRLSPSVLCHHSFRKKEIQMVSAVKKLMAAVLSVALIGSALPAPVRAQNGNGNSQGNGVFDGKIKYVLLISVDGLHALDVANYVQANPGSAMAELSSHGITYSNARTPANSDSFPGLLALVTGGSPNT